MAGAPKHFFSFAFSQNKNKIKIWNLNSHGLKMQGKGYRIFPKIVRRGYMIMWKNIRWNAFSCIFIKTFLKNVSRVSCLIPPPTSPVCISDRQTPVQSSSHWTIPSASHPALSEQKVKRKIFAKLSRSLF